MDVLPSNYSCFRNPEYWNHFYSNLKDFEWYVNFHDIEASFYKIIYEKSHLNKFYLEDSLISYDHVLINKDFYMKNVNTSNISIINIGTGNSLLPLQLQKAGCRKIISIDFEHSVIESMKKYENEVLKWHCVDVSSNEYLQLVKQLPSNDCKIFLDKAFFDAYISQDSNDSSELIKEKAKIYFKNSLSSLNVGDIFIIISLLQPYIIKEIVRNLFGENVLIDVYPIINSIKSKSSKKLPLIPYVIAIYKIDFQVKNDSMCRLHGISGVPSQHFSIFKMLKIINEIQFNHYTLGVIKEFNPGKRISFYLDSPSTTISYSITIYDSQFIESSLKNLKTAVVIAPPGHEQSYLFSTSDGNLKLTESSNCDRLIIVSFCWLDEAILYSDYQKLLNKVKNDLNSFFLCISTNDNIPIIACEDDLRIKRFVAKLPSVHSHQILIRDLFIPDQSNMFSRQLLFTSSPHTIQSEVFYKLIDHAEQFYFDRPCMEHHLAICMPVAYLQDTEDFKIAVLGSGVNVISNILRRVLNKKVIYHCIDIDYDVMSVSEKYFGNDLSNFYKLSDDIFEKYKECNFLNIYGDAIEYISMARKHLKDKYLLIIVDVNNVENDKDGINSPNLKCISDEFLKNISQILAENGLFIINVITTHKEAKKIVIAAFKRYFKYIKAIQMFEISNEIFICSNHELNANIISDSIERLKSKLTITFEIERWTVVDY